MKKKKQNGRIPMEFPPRRDVSENEPVIDDVVTREVFNTRHRSGVVIDNITEVITTEADKQAP